MNKQQIIDELTEINEKLSAIQQEISAKNQDGSQFDYVSHPRLSDAVDNLMNKSKRIERIVYQQD